MVIGLSNASATRKEKNFPAPAKSRKDFVNDTKEIKRIDCELLASQSEGPFDAMLRLIQGPQNQNATAHLPPQNTSSPSQHVFLLKQKEFNHKKKKSGKHACLSMFDHNQQ